MLLRVNGRQRSWIEGRMAFAGLERAWRQRQRRDIESLADIRFESPLQLSADESKDLADLLYDYAAKIQRSESSESLHVTAIRTLANDCESGPTCIEWSARLGD